MGPFQKGTQHCTRLSKLLQLEMRILWMVLGTPRPVAPLNLSFSSAQIQRPEVRNVLDSGGVVQNTPVNCIWPWLHYSMPSSKLLRSSWVDASIQERQTRSENMLPRGEHHRHLPKMGSEHRTNLPHTWSQKVVFQLPPPPFGGFRKNGGYCWGLNSCAVHVLSCVSVPLLTWWGESH